MTLDLVEGRLPLPIGGGVAFGVPPSDVDVLVENIPFWLAIDNDNPYKRETAQFRKEQIDPAPEAGEQSLSSWWQRSQMSFHTGTGLRYLDTEGRTQESDIDRTRFHDSRNVDVWTPGVVTRLNGTSKAQSVAGGAPVWLSTAIVGGVETLVLADGGTVRTYNGSAWTTVYTGTFTAFCTDGANWYAANGTGLTKGPLTGGAGTVLYTWTSTSSPLLLGWVKARLMLAIGASVYQLDANAAASTVLPAAMLLHPVAGWQWVAFCDTPNGIAGAGFAGTVSQVYKWEINTTSGDAILDAGYVLLTMPPGEVINCMDLYLGSMLILGSNRGVRISTFQSYFGTITLGPLVQRVGDGAQMSITSLSEYDRFVYAGTQLDGFPALLRVDLGSPLDQAGHYPWATDLLSPTDAPAGAAVTSVTVKADGSKWFGVKGYGAVQEGTTPDLTRDAWLETGRIRLTTVEDKNWCHAYVRGQLDAADPITVEVMTPTQPWAQAFVATVNADRFNLPVNKGEWLSLRFHLGGSAQLNSYVVQALPAGPRQRIISLPLWCLDYQQTRSDLRVGYDGWALERLAALEHLEQTGSEITLNAPALFPDAQRVVIEAMSYQQTQDPGDRDPGTGGRVTVQFRTTS